jgi:hypothetical protein
MAQRRARIVPLVTGPSIILKPDDFDWDTLENAYREKLSPPARQLIAKATNTYVAFRSREIASKPLRLSINRVKRLMKSAESFQKAIVEGDADSNANSFAHHEIKLQFSDDYLIASDPIAGLSRVVNSFSRACAFTIENLESNPSPAVDGNAWRNWIIELTKVASEFDLSKSARSDTDKNKKGPSPFVRLVKELQAQLPKELQQKRSEDALARAINRAREGRARGRMSASLAGRGSVVGSGRSKKEYSVPSGRALRSAISVRSCKQQWFWLEDVSQVCRPPLKEEVLGDIRASGKHVR